MLKRLTKSRAMRTLLTRGVFLAALSALLGFQVTGLAAQGRELWSIVIHFQYQDGFEFDYLLESGVSTPDIGAALAECGHSHQFGSAVQYYCYAVPE